MSSSNRPGEEASLSGRDSFAKSLWTQRTPEELLAEGRRGRLRRARLFLLRAIRGNGRSGCHHPEKPSCQIPSTLRPSRATTSASLGVPPRPLRLTAFQPTVTIQELESRLRERLEIEAIRATLKHYHVRRVQLGHLADARRLRERRSRDPRHF